jgi:hypothetical protein
MRSIADEIPGFFLSKSTWSLFLFGDWQRRCCDANKLNQPLAIF